MTDSCCCTTETNTTLKSNWPPIKNKLKNKEQKKKVYLLLKGEVILSAESDPAGNTAGGTVFLRGPLNMVYPT